jgi:cytochrome c biogenesis protein CcdA
MLGDLAFAFLLGLGTFFSPCAVALVPSYLAYYAGRPAGSVGPGRAAWDGLRVGAAASGGVLATFAVLALALYVVRSRLDVPSASLLGGFAVLGLLIGLVFVVLGVLMASGRSPGITVRLRAPRARTPAAMAGWGALFAAGSMGCSLPLALALLARLLSEPAMAPLLPVVGPVARARVAGRPRRRRAGPQCAGGPAGQRPAAGPCGSLRGVLLRATTVGAGSFDPAAIVPSVRVHSLPSARGA